MISSVNGEVIDIALDHVVIEAAGLGYRVNATPSTIGTLRRGDTARLLTTMVVREDSMTLYGFSDAEARELFVLVQTVSGVGPRLAMAILAVLEPDALCKALADGDHTTLMRVPGIGKRGAERLVVELRDKVTAPSANTPASPVGGGPLRDQVVDALVGLGFVAKQAEAATDAVLAENPDASTSIILRAALGHLGRKR